MLMLGQAGEDNGYGAVQSSTDASTSGTIQPAVQHAAHTGTGGFTSVS